MKIDSLGKYAVFALADFRRSKKWRTSKILNDMYTLVDMQDSMINGSEDMLNFPKVIKQMFTIHVYHFEERRVWRNFDL